MPKHFDLVSQSLIVDDEEEFLPVSRLQNIYFAKQKWCGNPARLSTGQTNILDIVRGDKVPKNMSPNLSGGFITKANACLGDAEQYCL